jgi:hypothetical protein
LAIYLLVPPFFTFIIPPSQHCCGYGASVALRHCLFCFGHFSVSCIVFFFVRLSSTETVSS